MGAVGVKVPGVPAVTGVTDRAGVGEVRGAGMTATERPSWSCCWPKTGSCMLWRASCLGC